MHQERQHMSACISRDSHYFVFSKAAPRNQQTATETAISGRCMVGGSLLRLLLDADNGIGVPTPRVASLQLVTNRVTV